MTEETDDEIIDSVPGLRQTVNETVEAIRNVFRDAPPPVARFHPTSTKADTGETR